MSNLVKSPLKRNRPPNNLSSDFTGGHRLGGKRYVDPFSPGGHYAKLEEKSNVKNGSTIYPHLSDYTNISQTGKPKKRKEISSTINKNIVDDFNSLDIVSRHTMNTLQSTIMTVGDLP